MRTSRSRALYIYLDVLPSWADPGSYSPNAQVVCVEKRGDFVGCYHSRTTNDKPTRKDGATQPMDHGRLRWAIFPPDLAFKIAKDCLLTGQEQASTSTTQLVGCCHAENGPIRKKMAVDCPLVITSIVKPFFQTRPDQKREILVQPVFCIKLLSSAQHSLMTTNALNPCSFGKVYCSIDFVVRQHQWRHWSDLFQQRTLS